MKNTPTILHIAIDVPLRRQFDYLCPPDLNLLHIQPGMRVSVPFGRKNRVGIILSIDDKSSFPVNKLKKINALLDEHASVTDHIHTLCTWTSQYYHHPVGEVFFKALPKVLRQLEPKTLKPKLLIQITELGIENLTTLSTRAKKQLSFFTRLKASPEGLSDKALTEAGFAQSFYQGFKEKGLIKVTEYVETYQHRTLPDVTLNKEQQAAADRIQLSQDTFKVFLLEGITGSGKTEVYLEAIRNRVKQGQQVLMLVPEISLTPQTIARFKAQLNIKMVLMHSALNDTERYEAFLQASQDEPCVVIGTRSAIFAPLPKLGLIIIDEEHDPAFKQQDNLRYHARDVAVKRAHLLSIPIVLGSATPSIESLLNAKKGRYEKLKLTSRYNDSPLPPISIINTKTERLDNGLSQVLLKKIEEHLNQNQQVLLFINRRGFAPTLTCDECGFIAECSRCDARLIYHLEEQKLKCHHCQSEKKRLQHCPECHAQLVALGQGTQRIETALKTRFPDIPTLRIDRDTTRKKGSLEAALQQIQKGGAQLLIGTQMLAKGHHFPSLSLVGILDADSALFSSDIFAAEKLAQTIIQVAGRAGRSDAKGEVILQTRHPDHQYFDSIQHHDYHTFVTNLLQERELAMLPPYSSFVLIRAEAHNKNDALGFLEAAKATQKQLQHSSEVLSLGPIAAPLSKRQGRYRMQLLLQSPNRSKLQQLLAKLSLALESLPNQSKVRWSLDVDPKEMV